MLREAFLIALLGAAGCQQTELTFSLEDRIGHAQTLFYMGKYQESAKRLEKIIKEKHSLPVLHALIWIYAKIGDQRFQEKKYQEAANWYQKSIDKIPQDSEDNKKRAALGYFHIGASYWWLFKEFYEKYKQNPQAECRLKRDQYFKQMVLSWHKTLELDPNHAEAQKYLEELRVK